MLRPSLFNAFSREFLSCLKVNLAYLVRADTGWVCPGPAGKQFTVIIILSYLKNERVWGGGGDGVLCVLI